MSTTKHNVTLEDLAATRKIEWYVHHCHLGRFCHDQIGCDGEIFYSLRDLMLSAQYKIYNVKDVSKEIGVDVIKICLYLDQIMKEAIKIATNVQAVSKAVSTSLSSMFEEIYLQLMSTPWPIFCVLTDLFFWYYFVYWVVFPFYDCGSFLIFDANSLSFVFVDAKGGEFYYLYYLTSFPFVCLLDIVMPTVCYLLVACQWYSQLY